jgi:hypothetical protein
MVTNNAGFVTSVTIYDTQWAYSGQAGIGDFNISIGTGEAATIPTAITLNVGAQIANIFSDPSWTYPLSPSPCSSYDCPSYLFPGNWQMMIPNPWLITNYSTADVMISHNTQGLRVDYGLLDSSASWDENNDCRTWGSDFEGAIQICIATSQTTPQLLNVGLYHSCSSTNAPKA